MEQQFTYIDITYSPNLSPLDFSAFGFEIKEGGINSPLPFCFAFVKRSETKRNSRGSLRREGQ